MSAKPFLKSSGKWPIVLASAAAVTVAGFGIFTYAMFRETPKEQTPTTATSPTNPSTDAAVTALGRLEPADGVVKLAAPATFGTARVSRLLVKEGSPIKQGQPIAVMDNSDTLLASAIQAQAEVREAQTRLAQVQAGAKRGEISAQAANVLRAQAQLAQAEADLQKAAIDFRRFEQLFKDGAVTQRDLDTARQAYQTALARRAAEQQAIEEARQTLDSVREVRPTDIQQAQARVQVAMANFQRARAELDRAVVRSPINGQVLKIHTDPGELVGNDGIAELGRTNQMEAVAEIYETDVAKVRVGQRAIVSSDAFSGQLTGTVSRVGLQVRKNDVLNTDPAADTDTRVVEVRIRLDNSQAVAGLTNLQVKIAIQP